MVDMLLKRYDIPFVAVYKFGYPRYNAGLVGTMDEDYGRHYCCIDFVSEPCKINHLRRETINFMAVQRGGITKTCYFLFSLLILSAKSTVIILQLYEFTVTLMLCSIFVT